MGCHTLPTPAQLQQFLGLVIPEICPPGEGVCCLDRAAFGDVAWLGERRPGAWWSGWPVVCGNVGDVGWCRLVRFVPDLSPVMRGARHGPLRARI
jgi:hypothetical protein